MENKNQAQVCQPFSKSHSNSEALVMQAERRTANYEPNCWKYDFLQSLSSEYNEEHYGNEAEYLKEIVRVLFAQAVDILPKLELVDTIKKLGLANHFEQEIREAVDEVASSIKNDTVLNVEKNLYVTALCFRLLRQHGYRVSQDMFNGFVDLMGAFNENKIKDLIELFEASHLASEGEDTLEKAKGYAAMALKSSSAIESNLAESVVHALELPSHWKVHWFDVKWHINAHEKSKQTNTILLKLAKLNFNMVQATLQKDLQELSRWWKDLGLIENLSFSRDRLVESFLCTVGLVHEPQFSSFRKCLTKAILMVLIIDDVYDVYGSLEELGHFTTAVDRWDATEIEQLPECMRLCFRVLSDITKETACEIQREKGWSQEQVQPHLQKVWADFCKALFVEAKWYNRGHTPSLQEYLTNAWISSSGTVLSVHSFFSTTSEPTEEMITFVEKNHDLVYNISLIIRLCNDLGTSVAEQERGDTASSVVCCMREMNVSEESARKHVKGMIRKAWKKINGQCFTHSPVLQLFANINTNMARVAHNLYQNRDGFGVQDRENKKQILSLLVEPFKLDWHLNDRAVNEFAVIV